MKRFFLLWITVLMLCGCQEKTTKVQMTDVKSFIIRDISLASDDYDTITYELPSLVFTKTDEIPSKEVMIKITTNDDIFYFYLAKQAIYYQQDDTYYKNENSAFVQRLYDLMYQYTDFSFYQLSYQTQYEMAVSDLYIKLDGGTGYYQIDLTKPIYNLRINLLEGEQEVALLYENLEVRLSKIVIRAPINGVEPTIKISFSNQHHYHTQLVPTLADDSDDVLLNITYIQP